MASAYKYCAYSNILRAAPPELMGYGSTDSPPFCPPFNATDSHSCKHMWGNQEDQDLAYTFENTKSDINILLP